MLHRPKPGQTRMTFRFCVASTNIVIAGSRQKNPFFAPKRWPGNEDGSNCRSAPFSAESKIRAASVPTLEVLSRQATILRLRAARMFHSWHHRPAFLDLKDTRRSLKKWLLHLRLSPQATFGPGSSTELKPKQRQCKSPRASLVHAVFQTTEVQQLKTILRQKMGGQ